MNFPLLYKSDRIALVDAKRLQAIRCHRACCQNRVRANLDARPDERARPYPRSLLHTDGSCDEIERRRFVIVIARAEKRALGNADVAFNHNRREIQQPTFLAQPHMVAHREFPRKSDVDAGADDDALPDFCAEPSQEEDAKGRGQRASRRKKQATHQDPQRFFETRGATVKTAGGKF